MKVGSNKKELIRMQRAILENLKDEIKHYIGREPLSVRRYYKEYKKEFKSYERIAGKNELIDKVLKSDIVLCGDYHTLRQAQRTVLRILREVISHEKKIVLAMELIRHEDQNDLDRYMKGELSEPDFLEEIKLHTSFPFNWDNYKPLFEFAFLNRIKIIGINIEPKEKFHHLIKRDRFAAQCIVDELEKDPEKLIFAIYGDLHLARKHLPKEVDKLLKKRGMRKKRLIIYQNSETIYWKLEAKGLEESTEVVKLRDDVYCVMNSTPWVKLQSYLNWMEYGEELLLKYYDSYDYIDEPHAAFDYSYQVMDFTKRIAEFLGLKTIDYESFEVHTMDDLSFLRKLPKKRRSIFRRYILKSKGCYIPDNRIIYLSSLDVNYSAEEGAEFLHHIISGYDGINILYPSLFYQRVMRKALGFLGSKLINHKRKSPTEEGYRLLLRSRKKLDKKDIIEKEVGRYVIAHQGFLTRLKKGKFSRDRIIQLGNIDRRLNYEISRALGYILGDKIYKSWTQNKISNEGLKDLFRVQFKDTDSTIKKYVELNRLAEMQ